MMSEMNALFETQVSSVMSNMVRDNAFRLDAGTYSHDTISMQLLRRGNLKSKKLTDIADVFGFGPFKRTYIADPEFGLPLLSSSEIMATNPSPSILAKFDCPKWSQYEVREGWIVISCSGTIGNVAIIPKKWNQWALSQHAIRIIPEKGYLGFIYTFIRLPGVKQQIVAMKSGSVIDEIYPNDLKQLNVPFPAQGVIDKLDCLISRVLHLREESDNLLSEANSFVTEFNGLAQFHKEDEKWFDTNKEVESVIVNSKDIILNNDSGSEYRLNAHFYNPMAQLAIENIKQAKTEVKTIDDVTERVFLVPRFKRNYVDGKYGVPFLSGKNIIQIRPTELKYLSKSETTNLELYYLKKNWTLITCSGTIGRTCFIWENYENYTATQHILRVVADDTQVDPGYLYAFLSSQYGKLQVLRYSHGSVIDEITDKQIKKVLIPLSSEDEQKHIGELVRSAYEKRAEAIRLEDEAQEILMEALT